MESDTDREGGESFYSSLYAVDPRCCYGGKLLWTKVVVPSEWELNALNSSAFI